MHFRCWPSRSFEVAIPRRNLLRQAVFALGDQWTTSGSERIPTELLLVFATSDENSADGKGRPVRAHGSTGTVGKDDLNSRNHENAARAQSAKAAVRRVDVQLTISGIS